MYAINLSGLQLWIPEARVTLLHTDIVCNEKQKIKKEKENNMNRLIRGNLNFPIHIVGASRDQHLQIHYQVAKYTTIIDIDAGLTTKLTDKTWN